MNISVPKLSITIPDVKQIADGIWKGILDPSEATIIGHTNNREGNTTIVLLTEKPEFKENNFQFKRSDASLINIGNGKDILFIIDRISNQIPHENQEIRNLRIRGDDEKFLDQLKAIPELEEIGKKLLAQVRKISPGRLEFAEKSKRFIERPDNFWTVKVQPRDRSLSITVRGYPRYFKNVEEIQLKEGMHGYSYFKINHEDELEEAIKIIIQARKKY